MSHQQPDTISRRLYFLAAAIAAFSGMGQMPIMKRYYIADLPFMAWTQDFFIMSDLHYLSAALLLGLFAWRLSLFRKAPALSWSWGPKKAWGWFLLTLIFVSGAFKVARNAGVFLNPLLLMVLDFVHLGSGMAFLFTGFAAILRGSLKRTAAASASQAVSSY